MKSTIGWILAILFGLLVLFLLPSLWMMGRFWMGGFGGMMSGSRMMGSYGYMHPFGWVGMLFAWLIPASVIVLLVVGAIALVKSLNRSGNLIPPPVVPLQSCPNCRKQAQAEWNMCPYCGQKLS